MKAEIPDISKQIYKEDILGVMESRYSTLGSAWVSHQMSWLNGIYSSYKDHNKFLIVIFLIKKPWTFIQEILLNYLMKSFTQKTL